MILEKQFVLEIANTSFSIARVACVNGEGEGERARKMGDWGLGTKERLLQDPHCFISCFIFHFFHDEDMLLEG